MAFFQPPKAPSMAMAPLTTLIVGAHADLLRKDTSFLLTIDVFVLTVCLFTYGGGNTLDRGEP